MIQTEESKLEFSSGLSSGAVLPFALRFFEKTDLQVYVTSGGVATLLSQDVDYTIADSSSYEYGANVTLQINPSSGAVVTVKRVLPVTQGLELPNHGKLPTESLEAQLDHATMVQQQHTEELARAFKVPVGDSRTASELIQQMISSGGGGGGGGSSYEFSNEFNVTSGGSVSVKEIDQSKITGLSSLLNEKQDTLVSGGSYSINVDSAGRAKEAESAPYSGPFALYGSNTPYGFYYDINGGNVYFGGSSYSISSSTGGSTPLSSGETIYLHFFSSANSYNHEYTKSVPSSIPDNHFYTEIAGNSGGKAVQYQFGNIFLPGFTSGGSSGGGASIESRSLGSHTESATGLLTMAVDMDSASPGQALVLTISGNVHSAVIVPQSGGTGITSSYVRVISSGQTWSASSEINASNIKMYFIKF